MWPCGWRGVRHEERDWRGRLDQVPLRVHITRQQVTLGMVSLWAVHTVTKQARDMGGRAIDLLSFVV